MPHCPSCLGLELQFEEVAGHGIVHQYSIIRESKADGFEEYVPYVAVAVELAEQPGLLVATNLVGESAPDVYVGMPVHLIFEGSEEFRLPQFTPDSMRSER